MDGGRGLPPVALRLLYQPEHAWFAGEHVRLLARTLADYGDAWDAQSGLSIQNFPQHSGFRGNLGVGVGLRVTTPIGPIRLDYGIGREGGRTRPRPCRGA